MEIFPCTARPGSLVSFRSLYNCDISMDMCRNTSLFFQCLRCWILYLDIQALTARGPSAHDCNYTVSDNPE